MASAQEIIERTAEHLIEEAERRECVAELATIDCHAALQDAGMSAEEAARHCAALAERLADYGENEPTKEVKKIEVCGNYEWIGQMVLDCTKIADTWRDEAAAEWYNAVCRAIDDMGYESVSARGQRSSYHGWNGANTFARKGCGLGTFDELTDAEWSALEDAASRAADEVNANTNWHVTDETEDSEAMQRIELAARQIAGAGYEEATGSIEERLQAAIEWENMGTDGDLTNEDRIALRLLLDAATGITSDLIDSETGDVIREATVEEAVESALALPTGHITVDGRRCYVALP